MDSQYLLLKDFHRIWHHEYLLSLWEQSKDLYESSFPKIINIGNWVGDDDRVRSVKVRKSDRGIHNHSLKYLYPLELGLTHSYQAGSPLDDTAEATVVCTDPHLDQVEPVGCSPASSKIDPSRLASKTRLLFSSNSHTNFRVLPVRDVPRTLSPSIVSDCYDIWVTPPSARTHPR